MQITLKEIVDARDAFINLSKLRLPIKQGYDFAKIIRKCNNELEIFQGIRKDIIQKYTSEGIEITSEINQIIMNELTQALNALVEIPVNKVDLSEIKSIEITPQDILMLEPFCIFETIIL